jgi:hypothetical protein
MMVQKIKSWDTMSKEKSLDEYLRNLIYDGYQIIQVIPTVYRVTTFLSGENDYKLKGATVITQIEKDK